ncbi:Nodulin-like [Trema orientale]|uniref:Nodulin-like n=1 Tax=Trema orientale TaxID=63057 RepID=A0A2P5F6B2_TREOI|nr:Nodulin-like [Trema orientale]
MGMCLFIFLGAHAQAFFDTTNVVSRVHNFSDYSGTIVGIMKVAKRYFLNGNNSSLIEILFVLFCFFFLNDVKIYLKVKFFC